MSQRCEYHDRELSTRYREVRTPHGWDAFKESYCPECEEP